MRAERRSSGMAYAPQGPARPVVEAGAFPVAAVRLDHGHIVGMCRGLQEAGATIARVFDPDPDKVASFQRAFPTARAVRTLEEVLDDPAVLLVAAAAVPSERGPLGVRVMRAGKDYFTDKTPFTRLDQLAEARAAVAETGRKYAVYYSERLHVECAVAAGQMIEEGAIGRVLQVLGTGPHRLTPERRPAWFFERAKVGGILADLGSHQIEQFLHFSGARSARVRAAAVANYAHPGHPELEDFGEASLVADNGASSYFRVDWFTPDGLSTWGDGRTVILGTEGTIELRKYVDVARQRTGDHLYLVDGAGERHLEVAGTVGYPFFGRLILDCLDRTETAMTQQHAFLAAELCLRCQAEAERLASG